MPKSRQLAAIMFTDIVGYTALMGKDEQNAFRLLQQNRKLQKPIIEEFNGRWIKELGDGVMASFNTVSDAVNAAVKIQESCNAAKDFQLRIGIHLGEVVFENDDVFGDGVNIAARIQAATQPGCIFISETVHQNVTNKNEFKSQFVKEMLLKNVRQPVRMYQVLFAGSEIIEVEKSSAPVVENSIAVLPFANMSNDSEQEYFSDGITEEIINVLAQVPVLK
ncbi:adenylate/guanylate cyclase domain-containing protein, partial [Muriicola sp.]|uniref:adenylate/guanylate cyclase domain-containing protein n=1 Tax=Muriicola sp. TaxID=2020856 RepID=UPI003C75614E